VLQRLLAQAVQRGVLAQEDVPALPLQVVGQQAGVRGRVHQDGYRRVNQLDQ
jgi:hypothetical protein